MQVPRFEDRRGNGSAAPVCLVVGDADGSTVDGLIPAAARLVRIAADSWDQVAEVIRPDVVLVAVEPAAAATVVAGIVGHHRSEWVSLAVVAKHVDASQHAAWLDAGADEVVDLGDDAEVLRARLRRLVRERARLVGLVRRNRELDELAGIDVLTDLPNRRRLDEQLRMLEVMSTRGQRPFGLLLLDVDHFKEVNDRLGHAAGDEVLREIAERLRASLRVCDALGRPNATRSTTVGRWAGDEFIVGLGDADREAVLAVSHRVLEVIGGEPIVLGEGAAVSITVSIGAAAGLGEPYAALLQQADAALYEVKNAARGTVAFASGTERVAWDRPAAGT